MAQHVTVRDINFLKIMALLVSFSTSFYQTRDHRGTEIMDAAMKNYPKHGWVVLVCSMQWYNVLQSSLL